MTKETTATTTEAKKVDVATVINLLNQKGFDYEAVVNPKTNVLAFGFKEEIFGETAMENADFYIDQDGVVIPPNKAEKVPMNEKELGAYVEKFIEYRKKKAELMDLADQIKKPV